MEMDHHHQYGITDLRQLISARPTHFPQQAASTSELFTGHRNLPPPPQGRQQQHPYEMMMVVGGRQVSDLMPRGLIPEFCADSAANNTATAAADSTVNAALSGLDGEVGSFGADIGGTGRWPRQETLTLLEIRSRLDHEFKEANQKGPLWDEVSRIMSEEHGYQRSGKKCREKFENLYKYYKKTKEGKAGRQDGKHYRFFRQLEALYGETSNSVSVPETQFVRFHAATNTNGNHANQLEPFHSQKLCDSLSLSNNSSEFDTTSSDDNDLSNGSRLMENDSTEKIRRKKRGGRSWRTKIKEFIDSQMRKLMERQEAWLEKLTKTLEQKEQERILREEEWRKQEAARIDREQKFWAKERAWIEARDAALMEALQNLTGRQLKAASSPDHEELIMGTEIQNENGSHESSHVKGADQSWAESEITRLIQLRTSMDSRFEQRGSSEEILWDEIAAKMACLGYDHRGAQMCKDKWESINNYLMMRKTNKKRKDQNSRSCAYFPISNESSLYNQGRSSYCDQINETTTRVLHHPNHDGSSPSNSNVGNATVGDSCFRFLMADGENLWENYGLKLSKGDNNNHQ